MSRCADCAQFPCECRMKSKAERIAEVMATYRVLIATTTDFSNEQVNKLLGERDAKIREIEAETE